MTEEETRSSVVDWSGTEMERTTGRASIPIYNFTPSSRRRQVASYLRTGRSRGIKREDLAAMMGLDERTLRRQIQQERQQGNLIISDCRSGYFLPESSEDIRAFVAQMKHRAREISAVTLAAERALANAEGQQTIFGWWECATTQGR